MSAQEIAAKVIQRFGYIQNESNTELNVRFWIKKNTDATDEECIEIARLYILFLQEKKRKFHEERRTKKESIELMEKINDECRANTGYSLIQHLIHQFNCSHLKYQLLEET